MTLISTYRVEILTFELSDEKEFRSLLHRLEGVLINPQMRAAKIMAHLPQQSPEQRFAR
jgi:hypothetical protein